MASKRPFALLPDDASPPGQRRQHAAGRRSDRPRPVARRPGRRILCRHRARLLGGRFCPAGRQWPLLATGGPAPPPPPDVGRPLGRADGGACILLPEDDTFSIVNTDADVRGRELVTEHRVDRHGAVIALAAARRGLIPGGSPRKAVALLVRAEFGWKLRWTGSRCEARPRSAECRRWPCMR